MTTSKNTPNPLVKPKRPTMYDVAKLAGVSASTVSLVLNGRKTGNDRISDETRQRVLDAVRTLGYATSLTARSLRRQKTERICHLIPRLGAPYWDIFTEQLETAADQHGYAVFVAVGGTEEREHKVMDQLRRGLADGVIIQSPNHLTGEEIDLLAAGGVAVTVLSDFIEGKYFDIVRTTEVKALREAIHHLFNQGRKRIAFLGSTLKIALHRSRYAVYLQTLEELGLPIAPELIRADSGFSREEVYQQTCDLLNLPEPPDAILAAFDIAAVSAIWAVRDAGLRIPQDVAVIGIGNIPEGEFTRPPLTTVGLGSLAFDDIFQFLFSRLEGQAPENGRIFIRETGLIFRGSA